MSDQEIIRQRDRNPIITTDCILCFILYLKIFLVVSNTALKEVLDNALLNTERINV